MLDKAYSSRLLNVKEWSLLESHSIRPWRFGSCLSVQVSILIQFSPLLHSVDLAFQVPGSVTTYV